MNRSLRIVKHLWLTSLFVGVTSGLPVLGHDQTPALSRAQRHTLWTQNIARLEDSRNAPIPEKVDPAKVDPERREGIKAWLDDFRLNLAKLDKVKLEQYERYIERARGHFEKEGEKDEIREALFELRKAIPYAPDKEKLLTVDWVKKLEQQAVLKAEGYREEGKWRKAHAVYYDLDEIFEDNKGYKKARRDCLNIARLNVIYTEDGRWEEIIEGIDVDNATDAMDRIEHFYVEPVDFCEVTAMGLETLMLFGQSEAMRETFKELADEELREEFTTRVKHRLEQVRDCKAGSNDARLAQQYFRRVLKINMHTVELPEQLIVYEFMGGALEALDDFTSVIWPVEFREFDKHTRGGFVGVGISITGGGDSPVRVVSPLEDTPAYYAGILPEDEITHVNGESIEGITLTKVVQLITGPLDTEVTLTVHRPAEKRDIDFRLKRAQVEIRSVKGYQRDVDDPLKWDYLMDREFGVGYVRVTSFHENTVDQLRKAIHEALASGAKGLILDLRFNPGGLMKSAIETAQMFLDRDDEIVSTRGLNDRPWQNPTPPFDGEFATLPLIVLVNEHSASASEIVSGALQDHDRAVIVGQRTFGKFSVQKLMQLGGGMAHLKLTTARYYLPSGHSFHHDEGATEWGVSPDLSTETAPKEILKVRDMFREREKLEPLFSASGSEDKKDEAKSNEDDSIDDEVAKSEDDSEKKDDDAKDGDDEAVADADADEDDEDEDTLNLAADPNEFPDIDLQLESAALLMRLHLAREFELRVAAAQKELETADVQSP